MTRYMIIKTLLKKFYPEDILIFTGNGMSSEAFNFDSDNMFYFLDNFGLSVAFALGVAMCTKNRVFVFVGEGDLLRETGVLAQVAASGCKNMFIILLRNDSYQEVNSYPNIFGNISNARGLFSDLGLLMFDYSAMFKDKRPLEHIKDNIDRLVGQAIVIIESDKSNKKYLKELNISNGDLGNRLELFLKKELESKLYKPPELDMDLLGGITNGV